MIKEDEAYCQPCVSPVWDTALTCQALDEFLGLTNIEALAYHRLRRCSLGLGRGQGQDRPRMTFGKSTVGDDLADGGASCFAQTVMQIKKVSPECGIELLIPDLQGDMKALRTIVLLPIDVLAHNLETV